MKKFIYSIFLIFILPACIKEHESDPSTDNIKIEGSKTGPSEQIFASIDSFKDLSLEKLDNSQLEGASFVLIEKSSFKNEKKFSDNEVEGYFLFKFDSSKLNLEKDDELKLMSIWSKWLGKIKTPELTAAEKSALEIQRAGASKTTTILDRNAQAVFAETKLESRAVFGIEIKATQDFKRLARQDNGRFEEALGKKGGVRTQGFTKVSEVPDHLKPYISQEAGNSLWLKINRGDLALETKAFILTGEKGSEELTIVLRAQNKSLAKKGAIVKGSERDVYMKVRTDPTTGKVSEFWEVVVTPKGSLALAEATEESTQNITVKSMIPGGETTVLPFEQCKDIFSPPNYGSFLLTPALVSSSTEIKAWLIDPATKEVKAQTTIPSGEYAVGQYIRTAADPKNRE